MLEHEVKIFNKRKTNLINLEDDAVMYEEQFNANQAANPAEKKVKNQVIHENENINDRLEDQEKEYYENKAKLEKELMRGLDFITDFKLKL